MSDIVYIDGALTVPSPEGEPRFRQPFAGVAASYILEQDFYQYGPNAVAAMSSYQYKPLALNTVYGADFFTNNSYPNFFLTAEGPLQDMGCGIVKWTRTYCKKPATRFEAASMSYVFPGLTPNFTVGASNYNATLRLPLPKATDVRITFDYFLIGASGANLASPDYADFINIPALTHQRWGYVAKNGAAVVGIVEINPPMLWDVPPAIANLELVLPNVTASQYMALMGTVSSTGQILTPPNPPNFFVAEDSVLTRWQGNIFCRSTKYIPYL